MPCPTSRMPLISQTSSTHRALRQHRTCPRIAVPQSRLVILGARPTISQSATTVTCPAMSSVSATGASLVQLPWTKPTATPVLSQHRRFPPTQLQTLLRLLAEPSTHVCRPLHDDVPFRRWFVVQHPSKRKTDRRSSGGKNCAAVEIYKPSISAC